MSQNRKEKDSLGEIDVPANALWSAQTQRAINNFPYGRPLPISVIHAIAHIKWCAAQTNGDLGLLSAEKVNAICQAADDIIAGKHDDQFPVDIYQTGSGTSSNMNVNEVISALCGQAGAQIHPNDDVNLGQSSNDVFPTAIHLAAIETVTDPLLPALRTLEQSLEQRASELDKIVKTGRTHLMDAMPITLGQEIRTWHGQLAHAHEQIQRARNDLLQIPQGGTAVGTGINTPRDFAPRFARHLTERTGHHFIPLENPALAQSAQDRPLGLSSALRALAVVLMKISNDLRWMNSGPIHGLAEITLPAVQPGSSIMPGKVNPVICESVTMVSAQIMGLDQANLVAVQSGNFQLNVMLPLLASNLDEMTTLLATGSTLLATKAIDDFVVNQETLSAGVSRNPILVTALNPLIGYEKAAEIAKEAFASGRPVIDVAREMTDLDEQQLAWYLDPEKLTSSRD